MRNELSGQKPSLPHKLEHVSSLLFIGVLLFATLVVPGIALITQWVLDVPASEQSEFQIQADELSAAEQDTLNRYRHSTIVQGETGSSGRHCSASSHLGADSIFTGLCSETAN